MGFYWHFYSGLDWYLKYALFWIIETQVGLAQWRSLLIFKEYGLINWVLKWGCDGTPNFISMPLSLVAEESNQWLFFFFLKNFCWALNWLRFIAWWFSSPLVQNNRNIYIRKNIQNLCDRFYPLSPRKKEENFFMNWVHLWILGTTWPAGIGGVSYLYF